MVDAAVTVIQDLTLSSVDKNTSTSEGTLSKVAQSEICNLKTSEEHKMVQTIATSDLVKTEKPMATVETAGEEAPKSSNAAIFPNSLAKPWVSKHSVDNKAPVSQGNPTSEEIPPFIKSLEYIAEEKHYTRDYRNNLLYKGQPVCRYLNTARGCQLGDSCRFKHIALGCVFNQSSAQGCCFGPEGKGCAFSHEPNAVVVSAPLVACVGPDCKRSCMSTSSVCRRCWNSMARHRRAEAQNVTSTRKKTFKAHIGAGFLQDAGWNSARPPAAEALQPPIGYYNVPVRSQQYGYMPPPPLSYCPTVKGRSASQHPPFYRMY